MTDEQYIQFIANYADWVAIKKLKIEEKTDPRTVMEFLASLTMSVDRKVEDNLRKIVALDKLDAVIATVPAGKTEDEVAAAIKEVSTRKVSAVIKEITELESLQKNERGELADFCRAYAMRKVLKNCKVVVDYSEIEIPGMKRVMKAGKK
jgi:hypothetical protein